MSELILPSTYLVTPEPNAGLPLSDACAEFIAHLTCSLEQGVRLVQLRAKRLNDAQYQDLAVRARAVCRAFDARLLLNGPVQLLQQIDADGVHLTSTRLMACAQRPLPAHYLLSVACHDAQQVAHANRIGADLMTISPVLPTATHTDATPLGWPAFAALAAQAHAPVYALGGMVPQQLERARAAGAHGIAAIRGLWAALDAVPPAT